MSPSEFLREVFQFIDMPGEYDVDQVIADFANINWPALIIDDALYTKAGVSIPGMLEYTYTNLMWQVIDVLQCDEMVQADLVKHFIGDHKRPMFYYSQFVCHQFNDYIDITYKAKGFFNRLFAPTTRKLIEANRAAMGRVLVSPAGQYCTVLEQYIRAHELKSPRLYAMEYDTASALTRLFWIKSIFDAHTGKTAV